MFDVMWRAYENELFSLLVVPRFQIFIDKECNLITNVDCVGFRVDYAGGKRLVKINIYKRNENRTNFEIS